MSPLSHLKNIFISRWKHPALIAKDQSFDYCSLYNQATGVGSWLSAKGYGANDTIALRLPNGWPFAVAYLACILNGYRFVPVNIELSFREQDYILNRVSPKFVLEDEAQLVALPPSKVSAPDFSDFPDTASAIFFTSGTTGFPKGVIHSINSLVGNAIAFNESQGVDGDIRMYHVLPMSYMAGFLNTLLCPWLAGGTVLIGSRFRPTNAFNFWQDSISLGANSIWITPSIASFLTRVNRDPEVAREVQKHFDYIYCGTAPLPLSVRRSFHFVYGVPLQESYGMSEVLLVSAQTKKEAESRCDVGKLLTGISVNFRSLQENSEQEIIIHTPYAYKEYLLESGYSFPLMVDGGIPTGDTGYLEKDTLIISGRLKDLIIRGGLNVSPVSIENVLLSEPGVQEVAVLGLQHEFWGESIVACLIAESGFSHITLENSLRTRCQNELSEGMRPDRYIWLKDLPRSTTGKIQKHILREQIK